MNKTQEILTHLQVLDQNNQFQAIIDYVATLTIPDRDFYIQIELARAYNNLYWQYKSTAYRHCLEKSIEILSTLSPENREQQDILHYNLGYAYYFLEDFTQAQTHLFSVQDYCLSHVHDLLKQIVWAKRYQISAVQAGLQHTHYLLRDICADIQQYLPELYTSFQHGISPQELQQFQENLHCELPNPIQQLYLAVNGQNQIAILNRYYSLANYFVALNDIPQIQQQWQQRLTDYFGADWHTLKLNAENIDDDYIHNQLFHEKWLPILVAEHHYICVDLAPKYTEDYGQMIYVRILPQLEECAIFYYCDALQDLLDLFWQELKSHYPVADSPVQIEQMYS